MAKQGVPQKHVEPKAPTDASPGTHPDIPQPHAGSPEGVVPDVDPAILNHPELKPATKPTTEASSAHKEPAAKPNEEPASKRKPDEPGGLAVPIHIPAGATVPKPGGSILLRARIREILSAAKLSEHGSKKVREKQRSSQIRGLVESNPDLAAIAHEALLESGSFKRIREMIRDSAFGDTLEANEMAQHILQEVRMQLADKAMRTALEEVTSLYPELTPRLVDTGTPGFGSDRDVTIQFRGGGKGSNRQRIDASLRAVKRAYELLRSQGIEPDAMLDTNFYTELHESSIRPESAGEARQILSDQSAVSLAEMRMGMSAKEWAAYREITDWQA